MARTIGSEMRVRAPGAMTRPLIVVVGGANTDVVGVTTSRLLARDSNPGHVTSSPGGVGRNIAENLARLGERVALVTVFGDDDAGRALRACCADAGIDVSCSLVASGVPGARYLAILDEDRDMAVAVNDMRALDLLVPEVLEQPARADLLAEASLVVADCNVPAATLEWIAAHVAAPIVLDPVSVAKAGRAIPVVPRLAAVTPNAAEAGALLGREVAGIQDAAVAAVELVRRGAGSAFVTCGTDGTAWADAEGGGIEPCPEVEVVNASGAGDAFCAGVAWALARAKVAGTGAAAAARAGTVLAALALTDEDTVSRNVTPRALP